MEHYVYVLDKDGQPLMPTTRYAKVRRMLESGKAKAVCSLPFTIQLTYETETHVVQEVRISEDPGRENIGLSAVREDGKCLFRAHVETRNKEIPRLMGKRRQHRQASRRGERLARKRLARRLGTTMGHMLERKLPGYKDGVVRVKDIINTEARSNNRKKKPGWIDPTTRQLLQTHENLIVRISDILPIRSSALEYNRFDFEKLKNPKIKPWEYGHGPLEGFHGSIRRALVKLQGGRCLLCGKGKIENDHHLVPRSLGGSDTIDNIAGLCLACHERLHHDDKLAKELSKKKEGMNKKYHHLSVLNQIMGRLTDWMAGRFHGEAYAVKGEDTWAYRNANGLAKDHDVDAYCIAAMTFPDARCDTDMPPCYEIKQFRRHDRAIIKAQVYRSYHIGKEKVAQNRHKATEASIAKDGKVTYKKQGSPSLEDWYEDMKKEHGEKEAQRMRSRLRMVKSYRRYNNTKRHLPGSIFIHEGKRYVMSGQISNGTYLQTEGSDKNFPAKDCIIFNNTGIVYLY